MVRSLYSGVSGMKAHQTRMDVIGNNIANVNTYGFKSSRVTFRDVYYQTTRGASQGTGTRGGLNPAQVGYGSTVGSVDVLQTQSVMSRTGNPLDLAITGEGFFQVQDADGNMFYTKAGMLDIDSYGNLVDVNGNFVLGVSGNPIGQAPASNRIQFNIPSVDPKASSTVDTINGIKYTVSTSKATTEGNLSINILSVNDLPIGQKAEAVITSAGINICLNAKESFADIGALNTVINDAIKSANGGKEHPAGVFNITMDPTTKFANLTGAEIAGKDFGITKGTLPLHDDLKTLFSVASVGDNFSGNDVSKFTIANSAITGTGSDAQRTYQISVEIGGKTYQAEINSAQMKAAGSVVLKSGTEGDDIVMNYPSESSLVQGLAKMTADVPPKPEEDAGGKYIFDKSPYDCTDKATPSTPSKFLGLSSKPFKLEKGTEGGVQSVKDLTGIAIGADGVIVGTHAVHGMMELGRIDLATFENAQGLAQSGNTYFTATPNSGKASLTQPGINGTGGLASSALEMSNVDLSQEFADMITTQRGFQANSRLITVSDTMLEELINLKR
ncbi:flagellar hook-basal body complex protein [Oscillospiraceae bacterium PP1C4]